MYSLALCSIGLRLRSSLQCADCSDVCICSDHSMYDHAGCCVVRVTAAFAASGLTCVTCMHCSLRNQVVAAAWHLLHLWMPAMMYVTFATLIIGLQGTSCTCLLLCMKR
jgi:hypothetical protein